MKNDLSGLKFNRLTVIDFVGKKATNNIWNCICDCGNKTTKSTTELKTGKVKSCGCLRKENHAKNTRAIIEGRRFGALTVLKFDSSTKDGTKWLCQCDCGVKKVIPNRALRSGGTVTCGCRGATLSNQTQINIILSTYKNRANKKELEFSLTNKTFEALLRAPCYYCGIDNSNTQKDGPQDFKYNGIDRIDNTKGYIDQNVVTCCKTCNIAKSTLELKDFTTWITRVYNHLIK